MALKRFYESQEEIPEEMRGLYIEKDGRFALDAEPGDSEVREENLRRALQAKENANAERDKYRQEIDALKEQFKDFDPNIAEEYKKMQQARDDMEHQRLIDEKKFEEAAEKKFQRQLAEMKNTVQKMQEQHEADMSRYETLRTKYQKTKIPDQLGQVFLSEGADPKKLPFLLSMAQSMWELDEEDEPTPVEWVDGGRTKITAVGADGKTLTMKEHAKSMLADNIWAVLESRGSGSSHQSANGANGSFRMTETEAKDLKRYEAVREQANKAGVELEIVPG